MEDTPILEICQRLTEQAKAKGATAADAVAITNVDSASTVRLGKIEAIERSESSGVGLRVFVDKRKAIVSSTDLRESTLSALVERAVDMAKLAPEDPYTGLATRDMLSQANEDLDLIDTTEPSIETLNERAIQAEAVALDTPGITNSDGADASYSSYGLALATSEGFAQSYQGTSHSISACVLAGEGTAMERDYDYSVARHAEDLASTKSIGKEAAERTLARLNPRKPKTCEASVVYDPRVSKNLVGAFVGAINGASIARGTSFLKDKKGERIFGDTITVVNDPSRKRGLASKPFDAEGVAPKRMNLIDQGVLTDWLLDIRSANQLGLKTNGMASRSLASNPSPSSYNVHMEAGDISVEDLISDIKSGFYVTDTFGTGVNGVTGDYSQGASGFWIENGKIAYPVSELTIAGHLLNMFASARPANDLEFKYGTNCPTLRVDNMMIAGE